MKAFSCGLPIGVLGGLIGLGGAEFRLPVLTRMLGFKATSAVPINLAISLMTVMAGRLHVFRQHRWMDCMHSRPRWGY